MDKIKQDLYKNLSKIFTKKEWDYEADEIKPEDYMGYTDDNHIMMVIPKTKYIKELIVKSFNVHVSKIPSDMFKEPETKQPESKFKKSIYDPEHMKHILQMVRYASYIKFRMGEDYPLWAETDELIFLLAPRSSE